MATIPLEQLPTLFGKNLKHCLVNQSEVKERYLHGIADQSIEVLLARAAREPEAAAVILNEIIDTSFAVVRKIKIVERLLAGADLNTMKKIIPRFAALMDQTSKTSKDEKKILSNRQLLADMMVNIVRAMKLPNAENISQYRKIVSAILKIFADYAYSAPDVSSVATREMFQSRLASCFTKTIAMDSDDPAFHPYYVLRIIREGEPKFTLNAASDVLETIEGAVKTLEKITKKEQTATETTKETLKAIKLLFVFTVLQVYHGEVDTINVIDELQECYKSLKKHNFEGIDDEGAETLVEILIGFVSKPSLLFRRLVSSVFTACTWAINEQGLQSMIDVS